MLKDLSLELCGVPVPGLRLGVFWRMAGEMLSSTMQHATFRRSLATPITCMRGIMAPPTSPCWVPRQVLCAMFGWLSVTFLLQEWGGCGPTHQFLGSYRLEHDRSWTPADLVERRSKDIAAIDRVIQSQNALDCLSHGASSEP